MVCDLDLRISLRLIIIAIITTFIGKEYCTCPLFSLDSFYNFTWFLNNYFFYSVSQSLNALVSLRLGLIMILYFSNLFQNFIEFVKTTPLQDFEVYHTPIDIISKLLREVSTYRYIHYIYWIILIHISLWHIPLM